MNPGVASTLERTSVILLFPMVGQRLSGHLAAGNSAPICESSYKQGIRMGVLLESIQHVFDALIHKRYGAHLNADGFRSGWRRVRSLGGGGDRARDRAPQEVPAVHMLENITFPP